MSGSSSTTRSDVLVAGRVTALASGLGVPPPPAAWMDALNVAFARPLDDPAYAGNALCPGGWPVETSFAETAPRALRLDLAPLDPGAPAADRSAAAIALAGIPGAALRPWRNAVRPDRFGAFASVTVAPGGAVDAKAYLELDPDRPLRALPGPAGRLAAGLGAYVPDLRPHLAALSPSGDARVYLHCASGLRLLALLDWSAAEGLAAPAPALLDSARRLTGGRLVLSEPGVLLAVRTTRRGRPELKVELTSAALSDGELVGPLLVDRPASHAAYRHWRSVVGTDVTVVSVRIGGGVPGPRFNAYAELLPRVAP